MLITYDLTKETVKLPDSEHLMESETREIQAEAVLETSNLVDISFKEPERVLYESKPETQLQHILFLKETSL